MGKFLQIVFFFNFIFFNVNAQEVDKIEFKNRKDFYIYTLQKGAMNHFYFFNNDKEFAWIENIDSSKKNKLTIWDMGKGEPTYILKLGDISRRIPHSIDNRYILIHNFSLDGNDTVWKVCSYY